MPGVRKTEARRWFQQAAYDLEAARWNVKGAFYNTACFLTQQAGEKALKSLLYYLGAGRAVLMTHSLVEMIEAVGERVGSLPSLLHLAPRTLHIPHSAFRIPQFAEPPSVLASKRFSGMTFRIPNFAFAI